MIALARFVSRGRSQAVLVISVFAMLALAMSLLLPPLAMLLMVVSGAALALVTLSNALHVAIAVLSLAYLFCAGILLVLGIYEVSISLLLFWLPVLISADVLRRSRNLALAVLVILLVAVVFVLALFAVVPDPAELWNRSFEQLQQIPELAHKIQISQEQFASAARFLTGYFVAWFLIVSTAGLLIGRWWQGSLVNPEGFKREFYNLRLGRALSVVSVVAVVIATVTDAQFLIALSASLFTVYLFQGLAVMHAFTMQQPRNRLWMIAFYTLLLLFPVIVVLVSLWGIVDAWLDSRRRWLPGNS